MSVLRTSRSRDAVALPDRSADPVLVSARERVRVLQAAEQALDKRCRAEEEKRAARRDSDDAAVGRALASASSPEDVLAALRKRPHVEEDRAREIAAADLVEIRRELDSARQALARAEEESYKRTAPLMREAWRASIDRLSEALLAVIPLAEECERTEQSLVEQFRLGKDYTYAAAFLRVGLRETEAGFGTWVSKQIRAWVDSRNPAPSVWESINTRRDS